MRGAWRVEEIRAAEQALMATLPDGVLMRRASAGLARRCAVLLADRRGRVYGARVLALVGAGNNGGDALYAGALLARRGAQVSAVLLAPDKAHAGGLAALRAAGGRIRPAPATGGRPAVETAVGQPNLVIDGVVGIGGRGGLRPEAAGLVAAARATGAVTVAVDLPSGVDADTGAVTGDAVSADVTVTFGGLKPGLVVGAGAARAGLVELVDIGLEPYLPEPYLRVLEAADVAALWPVPQPSDDKYRRGVVGVASGSATYTGAALLSLGGALAGPAGFVRYAGTAAEQVRGHWPEVVVTEQVAGTGRVQAWVVGSGLGLDEHARTVLRAVLGTPVPVCVDADGITLLAEDPAGWLDRRDGPVVLTPHDREFARLSGEQPGDDRIGAARRLASWLGAVVLLKGDRTIVAGPDGTVYVNPTGTADLATAGTGDVLAGLLGSLLAAGLPADRAAAAAAFVHGLAGRYAARGGPVTAQHVMRALRPTIAELVRNG